MKKRVLSLALLLSAGANIAFGQGKTVKGTVVDEAGNPLIGVTIETVDEKMSTFTDVDGNFEMEIPAGASDQLKISYLDMNTTTSANDDLSKIVLKKQATSLDGVVITGYRTVTKEKYVGAADNITAEQIEKMPVADVTRALEGAAPGLQFAGGGDPGAGANIRIRGFGSVTGSSAPLFVVDGTPYAGDITSINPSDIENVTVLKDATATSLYGSRGSNGVIVITTKRGKSNKNKEADINIDLRTGIVQRGVQNYDVMTSEAEYYEMTWQAYVNNLINVLGYDAETAAQIASGQTTEEGIITRLGGYNSYNVDSSQVVGLDGKINPAAKLKYHDVWDDEITRMGKRNEVNLNIGNRDEKNDYYFSLGYLNEQGFIKYTDYQRISGRMNINSQVKKYLKVGLNLSGTISDGNFTGTADGSSSGNPMFISKDWAPIFPVYYYNAAGQRETDPITGEDKFDWGAAGATTNELLMGSSIGERPGLQNSNILGSMMLNEQSYKTLNLVAVPYIEVNFLENFTFNTLLNYNYYDQSNINMNNKFYGQFAENGGNNSRSYFNSRTYTFRQMLSYNKFLNKDRDNLNIFAVHENYDLSSTSLSGGATGIPIPGNSNLSGATTTSANSADDYFRMESYLVGASYIYDNNLFFDGSARWDGTSRFGPTVRWNTIPFWALGVGYNLKSADFLKEVEAVKDMKVKMSYGTQGNQNIGGYYVWQSLYGTTFPNGTSLGGLMTEVGNDKLTWEAQGQFNAGLEFNLFNDKLSGEINFFNRNTTDLLFMVPTAPSMGIQQMPMNTASMFNRGVEVSLGSRIFKQITPDDFGWSVNLNLTHFKNQITKMPDGLDSFISGQFMYKKGHSIYDFYIVESAGINQATGTELYYTIDSLGNRVTDSVWANVSSKGRVYHGTAIPDLYGTFTNSLDYKGFNLQFTLAFGLGGDYYDGVYASMMQPGSWGRNWHRDILNSWTPTNTNTNLPRVEMNNIDIGGATTRFLIDASYLNIRNITLGYTLPTKWTDKMHLNNVRVYALFDNVHLFSRRQGMNPQSSFSGQSGYTYTPARTMMFGVKFNL